MKKFLTYDLETTFLQKGQKRPSQRILEIALYKGKESFSAMINPCEKYSDGKEVIQSLQNMRQHPEATLRFWTKLLVEKKALPSHFKRSSIDKQANGNGYTSYGKVKQLNDKTVLISELPIGVWTDRYKDHLLAMVSACEMLFHECDADKHSFLFMFTVSNARA